MTHKGIRRDSPTPSGYDLSTAAGYEAWRAAGGLWKDETPERMAAWRRAQVEALAADVDLCDVVEVIEQQRLREGIEDAYAAERSAWDFLPDEVAA